MEEAYLSQRGAAFAGYDRQRFDGDLLERAARHSPGACTAIAMDFPVATGRRSHPTPAGNFTIRGKEKNYSSNLYGKIYDAQNALVVADADVRTDRVPEGGRFQGAIMPYWMRLTDTGVGLHVGYVPGRPASHGCIRLKRDAATQIFDVVKIGTPVVIAERAPGLQPEMTSPAGLPPGAAAASSRGAPAAAGARP